jgi:hypothetical protein
MLGFPHAQPVIVERCVAGCISSGNVVVFLAAKVPIGAIKSKTV